MYSSLDRHRFRKMVNDDPTLRTWLLTTRCAAGVRIIALIAVIGVAEHDNEGARHDVASMQAVPRMAEQDRREKFEERRRRFAATDDQRAKPREVGERSEAEQATLTAGNR